MSVCRRQRTRELSVRLALGARPQALLRMVLREALVLGFAGAALGLLGALLLSRSLATLLYSVSRATPSRSRRRRPCSSPPRCSRATCRRGAPPASTRWSRCARNSFAARDVGSRRRRGGRIESARPMSRLTPRVLAADDQPDVLEALRLLLKPEGFELETANSPKAVLAAAESRELDVVLIDLNYTRDTTSGREGNGPAVAAAGARPHATGGGDDSLGQRGRGGRADAARGARLRAEAVENARLVATLRTQAELSRALRRGQRLEARNSALRDAGRPQLIASPRRCGRCSS